MVDLFATDALLAIDFNCHKQSEKNEFCKKAELRQWNHVRPKENVLMKCADKKLTLKKSKKQRKKDNWPHHNEK